MKIHKQIFKAALGLIINRSGWCQGVHARDADGEEVSPFSIGACSFCADGAIQRATLEVLSKYSKHYDDEIYADCVDIMMSEARDAYGTRDYVDLNDNDGGHSKIVRLLRRCILRTKSNPKKAQ